MINFRYHVVSLTAVFLALAIGLVVGTAALNGPVADDLSDRVNGLSNHNNQLREQVSSMKEEVNRQEDFAVEAAPWLITGELAGRRVAVVSLPAASDNTDAVVDMLAMAGAKVTARVAVTEKLTDPANNDELLDLVQDSLPIGVSDLPRNSGGPETAGALLAAVLLDRQSSVSTEDRIAVLTAYRTKGYITVADPVTEPAQLVVMLAGTAFVDRDAATKNKAMLTLATQFDVAAPIVLAGTGVAGDGNTLSGVRGDPTLNKTISTVDNVHSTQGRIATVLALAEQTRPGTGGSAPKAGQYGIDAPTLMPKRPE